MREKVEELTDKVGDIIDFLKKVEVSLNVKVKEDEIQVDKRFINMNEMANKVALKESGKVEVNIAQIKEVLKIFLLELAECSDEQVLELVKRYKR
jgi:hypothetical protein